MSWYKKANLNIPAELYHATYHKFLQSILNKGLIPRYECIWEDCEWGVYLAKDQYIAESYAETAESEIVTDDDMDNIIILKINTSMLNISKFGIDPHVKSEHENETTFIYKGIIPPAAVSNIDRLLKGLKI